EVKAMLDRNGLTAPTTHVSPPNGPDLEKTLDAYASMGHKYTTVNVGGEGRGRGGPGGPGGAGAAGAPAARPDSASRSAAPGETAGAPRPPRAAAAPQTLDAVKRTAEARNQAGRITQNHGIKA